MRNIFLFIRRHFNLLLFLFLEIMSVYFIVSYSNHHKAAFGGLYNSVTGRVNEKYANVQQYFYLKKVNDSLIKANEELYNKLKQDFSLPDTASHSVVDSIKIDSLLSIRKINYLHARVVSNAVSSQSNYIVLSRGKKGGVKIGMGVVDPNNGVVGIVTDVDEQYATVMSLLHKDSHISGRLQKSGETGTLSWDGAQPNIIFLTDIPNSAKVAKGDKIVSSGFSTAFPRGLSIGTVDAIFRETRTNDFRIRFKTSADFYNLQYVYVIDNADRDGVNNMLNRTTQLH